MLSQAGFDAGLFEKRLDVPSVSRRDLRKKNTPFSTARDLQAVPAHLERQGIFYSL